MTDAEGRYIVEGVSAVRNKVFISASRPGFDDADVDSTSVAFAANSVTPPHNFALDGTAEFATVGGTVVLFGSTTPVAGVEIRVDENAPMNKNEMSKGATTNDIYVTGKDGTYTRSGCRPRLGQTPASALTREATPSRPRTSTSRRPRARRFLESASRPLPTRRSEAGWLRPRTRAAAAGRRKGQGDGGHRSCR